MTHLEHLALIGNCQYSALVENTGSIVWCCLPRFDSEPVFASLLDAEKGGRFLVGPEDGSPGVQRYLDNTNVLETTFDGAAGSFRVVDFAPRFHLHGRAFRPTQIWRIVEPLRGSPRIRVVCDPRLGWSNGEPARSQGSHHVNYAGFTSRLRLTTDFPLSYLGGTPFALTGRRHLTLTWGDPVEEPLAPLADRFHWETVRHWQSWVKHCEIPPMYQAAVIRSALALKLHCFEDTGAIVASMTTSIPESPGTGRTWDYRYCWLRDAYYALGAFRWLGHFEEREQFIQYLLNVASSTSGLDLSPLYRIDGATDLDERVLDAWPGYGGERPVRVGNAAARQPQNDIFGEMVLALAPVFLDDRFRAERTADAFSLIERLTRKAIAVAGAPDAGIWEYRLPWKPQTFSSLMCWAAADRMSRIAARHSPGSDAEFRDAAEKIREQILLCAWDGKLKSFVGHFGGQDHDASLLQMVNLRFLPTGDPRLANTVDAIQEKLLQNGWLHRYDNDDGFGKPAVAFVLCSFWLVEALSSLGRQAEAAAVMERIHASLTPVGLLSEDYDPVSRRLSGNFPQAYSHVGLIHAAFAASPSWSEVL